MIKKLGVQAYTFRDAYNGKNANEKALENVFTCLKSLGYDEIQTDSFGIFSPHTFARLAHDAGLEIVGTFNDYDEMIKDPEEIMRLHREVIKSNLMGVAGLPDPARESKEELFKFIDTYNQLGDKVKPYGFKLIYHNHHFEFVRFDNGKTIMDYLYEGLNPETISFCLDTHWVQRAGGNPTTWIEKLANRIDILHLKDMAVIRDANNVIQPLITEIGNGNIDFDSVIAAAEKGNVKYYCVEQDTCPGDPMDSLKISAEYLKRYM